MRSMYGFGVFYYRRLGMSKKNEKEAFELREIFGGLVYDGGELLIDFEAFDDWHRRFIKRFFDGVDASEVAIPDDLVKSHLKKVKYTLFNHTLYTTVHERTVAGTTDNVIKTTFNYPELCADLALLAFDEREDQ